jgi:hypothetical protein
MQKIVAFAILSTRRQEEITLLRDYSVQRRRYQRQFQASLPAARHRRSSFS